MSLKCGELLKRVANAFPSRVGLAFAYGSSVFKQRSNVGNNVIDLVFAVDEPCEWHRENMRRNSRHYSFLKYFGPEFIAKIQQNFGAKVYYNTLVPLNDANSNLIKYGVIKVDDLINDLLDWQSLYISGRLHKPVKFIIEPQSEALKKALQINHQSAVHLSLLLLHETFTEEQLYMTIAGISYDGDFRMIIGEDKNKVANIVKPNIENFRAIYKPYLDSEPMQNLLQFNQSNNLFVQNCSSGVIFHHLSKLPKTVQQLIYLQLTNNKKVLELDNALMFLAKSYRVQTHIQDAVRTIVRRSSYSQTFKGLFTAGVMKSIKYGSKKLFKMGKSLLRPKSS